MVDLIFSIPLNQFAGECFCELILGGSLITESSVSQVPQKNIKT